LRSWLWFLLFLCARSYRAAWILWEKGLSSRCRCCDVCCLWFWCNFCFAFEKTWNFWSWLLSAWLSSTALSIILSDWCRSLTHEINVECRLTRSSLTGWDLLTTLKYALSISSWWILLWCSLTHERCVCCWLNSLCWLQFCKRHDRGTASSSIWTKQTTTCWFI
jgi:hypothetical protein